MKWIEYKITDALDDITLCYEAACYIVRPLW